MKILLIGAALVLSFAMPASAASPVVLELFTSQSCSSCPPADALLQALAKDSGLLALSFHVDYWDGAAWTDPFSRPASTERQRGYAAALKQDNVYTPELVVDGKRGMVGSRRSDVTAAIETARAQAKPLTVDLTPSDDNRHLTVTVKNSASAGIDKADIWLVAYNPQAVTAVHGGENSGRELTSINNVTAITRLGQIGEQPLEPLQVDLPAAGTDSYAVLVQGQHYGPILGAGQYTPSKKP